MKKYIVADIGGTQTRIGSSHDLKTIRDKVIYQTPKDFESGMKKFVESVNTLDAKPDAVVIGVAGPMNKEKSMLIDAPHLTGWIKKDIKYRLESDLETEVYLENDTALVGLGEAHNGAGRSSSIMVYLSIGTGVGGVRIVDGEIDENTLGFEPGHQTIDIEDGTLMTLESLVSGGYLNKIDGSSQKEKFVEDAHLYLAIGIRNSILHWSPDTVVVGGGMIIHRKLDFGKVLEEFQSLKLGLSETPVIKKAELGEIGGLHGGINFLLKAKNSH